jgi:hypothetical protein
VVKRGNNMDNKLFVVRKYIMASSAIQAIRKDKTSPVDDVWVDEDFKKDNLKKTIEGFKDK